MIIKRAEVHASEAFPGLIRRVLANNDKVMLVEHWHTEKAEFPWHSHPHEQLAYILSGTLIVETEKGQFKVEAGDSFIIPGGVSHRVIALEEAIALDFFTPTREDYLEKSV